MVSLSPSAMHEQSVACMPSDANLSFAHPFIIIYRIRRKVMSLITHQTSIRRDDGPSSASSCIRSHIEGLHDDCNDECARRPCWRHPASSRQLEQTQDANTAMLVNHHHGVIQQDAVFSSSVDHIENNRTLARHQDNHEDEEGTTSFATKVHLARPIASIRMLFCDIFVGEMREYYYMVLPAFMLEHSFTRLLLHFRFIDSLPYWQSCSPIIAHS